jgi:hypothetical protein
VSPDFQVPQGVADVSGGVNRAAKIEALVSRRQSGLIVVMEDPSDEHNAGAVFRSCDAFGATEVWIIHNGIRPGTSMRPHVERGEAFEPDSRAVALASSSASRWVASRTLESTEDAIAALRADGYCNVATCFTERSRSARRAALPAIPCRLSISPSRLVRRSIDPMLGCSPSLANLFACFGKGRVDRRGACHAADTGRRGVRGRAGGR